VPNLLPERGHLGVGPEAFGEGEGRSTLAVVLGGGAKVQKVSRWVEDGNGLHGAAPSDAQAFGVHPIFGCAMADKADAAVHVVNDVHDGGLGLRDMANGEDVIAGAQDRGHQQSIEPAGPLRLPAAGDHQGNAESIGLLWAEDVERQRSAVALAIHDAVGALDGGVEVDPKGTGNDHQGGE